MHLYSSVLCPILRKHHLPLHYPGTNGTIFSIFTHQSTHLVISEIEHDVEALEHQSVPTVSVQSKYVV